MIPAKDHPITERQKNLAAQILVNPTLLERFPDEDNYRQVSEKDLSRVWMLTLQMAAFAAVFAVRGKAFNAQDGKAVVKLAESLARHTLQFLKRSYPTAAETLRRYTDPQNN
ncbi:hypothetical protein [Planctomyces sp. SH-PL14]|uniref:hypothetical protein n=1 Tax=Planctomyces sp. SH-PL14 TaxID=1632864 RepID=UPI00078E70EA|nr:hypothetical protein [Planctomyces sp. SH-PL14]AMV21780.1 hypothetical protein VT03_28015 [Planctomyces sp. SH-PL14]